MSASIDNEQDLCNIIIVPNAFRGHIIQQKYNIVTICALSHLYFLVHVLEYIYSLFILLLFNVCVLRTAAAVVDV